MGSISPTPYTRDQVRFDTDADGRGCYFHIDTGEPLIRVTFNGRTMWYPWSVTEIVEISEYSAGPEPMMQEARYRIEIRTPRKSRARGAGTRFYKEKSDGK